MSLPRANIDIGGRRQLAARLRPGARVRGRLQRRLKVRETSAAAQVIVDP